MCAPPRECAAPFAAQTIPRIPAHLSCAQHRSLPIPDRSLPAHDSCAFRMRRSRTHRWPRRRRDACGGVAPGLPPHMREDPLDQRRLLDARNDVQGRTNAAGAWMRRSGNPHRLAAARAALHVDAKDPLQPLCPAHRHMPLDRGLLGLSSHTLPPAPSGRRHRRTPAVVRCEYTVVSREVHPRARHQRRQSCNEVERLDKIAGSDFEQPKADPEGAEGRMPGVRPHAWFHPGTAS